MKKLYEKKPDLFAILFIVFYCVAIIPIRGEYGDGSIQTLLGLTVVAVVIAVACTAIPLWEKLGVTARPRNLRACLFLIPMWILSTGNAWDGFHLQYSGAALWYAMGSMALVGFVEEMIFRGFLFRAMLEKNGPKAAVIVSAVTFGIGHIVNLLSGMATLQNLLQIVFAVAWGFVFTMVYYKCGSLLPGIIAHAVIDVLAVVSMGTVWGSYAYIGATIVIGFVYSLWLRKLPSAFPGPEKTSEA